MNVPAKTMALFASVVLGGAAVWLGGLNQDEGWYLYAANLVADGKMPYRDFFYTQGPLLPIIYSAFCPIWKTFGLLGARLFNLSLGLMGIIFACALAYRLTPLSAESGVKPKKTAALFTFFLLATNLYHLYYLAIPKTYALAALFLLIGFYLLSFAHSNIRTFGYSNIVFSGFCLALAAGTRISLGIILAAVGCALLVGAFRKSCPRFAWFWFGLGGLLGLALVYGPILADETSRAGLLAAQRYHAARGGSDIVWTVGSLSRLVRWYWPLFIVLGLGLFGKGGKKESGLLLFSFLAVFVVQMVAPFPYEDYQVPIMSLLAIVAAVTFASSFEQTKNRTFEHLLIIGLCFASSFSSPLLEKWTTNGQDRFWSLKKEKTELSQLREVARRIKALDPDGKTLLTQDLYLAIETNRTVPKGLEMGPFAMLDVVEWRRLLTEAPKDYPIAALSGYTFAIDPPVCAERPIEQQLAFWKILKTSYTTIFREEAFGQNATPLLVLKRK